jgi:hypothetical protein
MSAKSVGVLCLLVVASSVNLIGQTSGTQVVSLANPSAFETHHIKVDAADYLGRKAIRLTTETMQDEAGFAMLPGIDFQDGTIEADIAVKILTPPGVRMPGFSGIGFRSKSDASEFELFYLRPKNALADDQAMRNHAVQYCVLPHHDWYQLRREWPFVYESYAPIEPERWIKMKIQVAGRSARVYLDGAAQPSLVVDGLKGSSLHGGILLWGYAAEETYFSNIRITPATAAPIKNGSDAGGHWEIKSSTDAGPLAGTLMLTREGTQLTGSWSGDLGKEAPVTGTWRDGYIELSFPAEWPSGRDGKPGPATAVLDGWIDDASAKGRIRVEGRTMGQWTGQRTAP